jgi:hypothetical protein
MSNPSDVPQPEQPGSEPPSGDHLPPAGQQPPDYQPPAGHQTPSAGHQPPEGVPAPGQPGGLPYGDHYRSEARDSGEYWQPSQPGRAGRFPFEMPADRPRTFNDAMPRGGFSGIFSVMGLPTELKVSYWIWVIGGLLALLFGVIGLFGALVLFAFAPGLAILVLLLVLVAMTLAAAQIVLAMKMKEGHEWARLALSIVAGVSLLLAVINSSFAGSQGGNWLGFAVSLVATVLMWVPNSQNWFAAVRGSA